MAEAEENILSLFEKLSEAEKTLQTLSYRLDVEGTIPVTYSVEDYNYLAIGNSLTRHGACSYWWHDEDGMAASDLEHDYVHLVSRVLEGKQGKVHLETVNMSAWEIQGTDRDETLFLLNPFLDEEVNLITIQLGENTADLDTFERDYESLINYIKERCPNARILIIGDFWTNSNRDELKKEAAENSGVEYVSLEGIKDNSAYYAGMGTTVYDEEGNPHQIDHEGVALHPGDMGMAAIADRIISAIEINDSSAARVMPENSSIDFEKRER